MEGFAEVQGAHLHYVSEGTGAPIIFLHGFPDFWYIWKGQMAEFGRDHQVTAPDLRGYNLSSKPAGLESYELPVLVEDVRALAAHLGYDRFTLVAHDWGGVIAWAYAEAYPETLERLVIINGPQMDIFRRELRTNPEQRKASAYIQAISKPDAEAMLSTDDYRRLDFTVFAAEAPSGLLDEEDRRAYHEAWAQSGALTAALNYYRAAHLTELLDAPVEEVAPIAWGGRTIPVPVLVLWGEQEPAVLPGNLNGLEGLVPDLTVRFIPGGHRIIHTQAAAVNAAIRAFVEPT